MGGISDLFKKMDRLSEPPSLTVKGNKRFRGKTGACCSLMAICIVLFFAIYKLWDFFQQKVMSIVIKTAQSEAVYEINMRENRLFPIFEPFNEQYFSFRMQIVNYAKSKDGKLVEYEINLPFVRCITLSNSLFDKYYKLDNQNSARILKNMRDLNYCIDAEYLEDELAKVQEQYQLEKISDVVLRVTVDASFSKDSGRFVIGVFPCNSDKHATCASLTEAEKTKAMQSSSFGGRIQYIEPLVNPENTTSPVQYSQIANSKMFFPKANESLYVQDAYQVNYIEDERGFPFSKKRAARYVTKSMTDSFSLSEAVPLKCTTAQFSNNSCNPYYAVMSIPRKEASITQRKFMSFTDLLSSVGGFYSSIWLMTSLLFSQFFSSAVNFNIVERVFSLKKGTKWSCLKKKRRFELVGGENHLKPSEKNFQSAVEVVEECLDIYSLVRQLTVLRVLTSFLLDSKSQKLCPTTVLGQLIKLKDARCRAGGQRDSEEILPEINAKLNPPHQPILIPHTPIRSIELLVEKEKYYDDGRSKDDKNSFEEEGFQEDIKIDHGPIDRGDLYQGRVGRGDEATGNQDISEMLASSLKKYQQDIIREAGDLQNEQDLLVLKDAEDDAAQDLRLSDLSEELL